MVTRPEGYPGVPESPGRERAGRALSGGSRDPQRENGSSNLHRYVVRVVNRRTFLVGAGSLATGGCLTALGVTERGPITAKWITATAETETRRLVYDSTEGERYVAEAHASDFAAGGRIFVSQDLHRRLNARYGVVEYRLRHECAGCGSPTVSRGDFNSVAVGDVAELTYSESGERATVVGVDKDR